MFDPAIMLQVFFPDKPKIMGTRRDMLIAISKSVILALIIGGFVFTMLSIITNKGLLLVIILTIISMIISGGLTFLSWLEPPEEIKPEA